ncbi:MAG: 16S rRNA (guanine(527)-N(7))-methyltransferase RsmG [Deltaproteobacteria bacterium]|jgi:16S rRNA (guanine527-N7)-methyltransferase|nr:16S rRNA (guanine(527)-N(7))-methyltransferase RsmG [Deltaproteobacteria bacterium]
MEIGSREWQNFIIDGAQQLGIAIDERISAAFAAHAAELLHWNRKINLTAITDSRDIAIRHFLDSLAPARFVPDRVRLLDIGSGAGFPGIPLKIFNPSLSLLLIDGTRKKVNFLKHVIRSLGLDQSEALHIRAENLGHHPELTSTFDVIISRALSDLTSFVNTALPLLAKRGKIIGMKGAIDQTELDTLCAEILGERFSLGIEKYQLPSTDSQRTLIIIKNLY